MKKIILISASVWSLAHQGQCQGEIPPRFPNIMANTLKKVPLAIPKDLNQTVNIVILVFERQAQAKVNTWAEMILSEMEPQDHISYYEIPMMSGMYSPIGWQIDNWMRAGIPKDYHDNTATFYGNRKFVFDELDISDRSSCYLFVLDKSGRIQFRAEGVRNPTSESEFRKVVSNLLENR